MTKHARRLTVALAILGAIALGAAGPSLAHRVASNPTIHRPATESFGGVDGDYVEILAQIAPTAR